MDKPVTKSLRFTLAALGITTALIMVAFPWLLQKAGMNLLALQMLKQLSSQAAASSSIPVSLPDKECHGPWYAGFLAQADGEIEKRNRLWIQAALCEPELIDFMHISSPQDARLASQVLEAFPDNAEAWFWDAEIETDPDEKIASYERGLALAPVNSRQWLLLGNLLLDKGRRLEDEAILRQAMQAFLQACKTGDYGSNGCMGAGSVAEELGDIPLAIQYYHMSHFDWCLRRAVELEQQLQQKQP